MILKVVEGARGFSALGEHREELEELLDRYFPALPLRECKTELERGSLCMLYGKGLFYIRALAAFCERAISTKFWQRIIAQGMPNKDNVEDAAENRLQQAMRRNLLTDEQNRLGRLFVTNESMDDLEWSISKRDIENFLGAPLSQELGHNARGARSFSELCALSLQSGTTGRGGQLSPELSELMVKLGNLVKTNPADSLAQRIMDDIQLDTLEDGAAKTAGEHSRASEEGDMSASAFLEDVSATKLMQKFAWVTASGIECFSSTAKKLSSMLEDLQNRVGKSVKMLEHAANFTGTSATMPPSDASMQHWMEVIAELRPRVSFTDLARSVLSSQQTEDLRRFNPSMLSDSAPDQESHSRHEVVAQGVIGTLFRANIIELMKRCLGQTLKLIDEVYDFNVELLQYIFFAGNKYYSARAHDFNSSATQAGVLDDSFKELRLLHENHKALHDRFIDNGLNIEDARKLASIVLQVAKYDPKKCTHVGALFGNDAQSLEKIMEKAFRGCPINNVVVRLEAPEEYQGGQRFSLEEVQQRIRAKMTLLQHMSKSLADALLSKRATGLTEGLEEAVAFPFNPQYCVFEFTTGFMLWQRQYDEIESFRQVAEEKPARSTVHQMIMGSGKTAVLSPCSACFLPMGQET